MARYQINLEGFADDSQLASATCSGFRAAGEEGFLRVATPVAGQLRVQTDGMDTVLYAYNGATCAGEPAACADNGQGLAQGDVLTVPTSANGTLTLVVDTYAAFSTQGLITLTLEMLP